MLGDLADAADVTQEVFLKAFRGIAGFRRGSSLKTWLYRIAIREALNHRRWSWRHLRQQISIDAENDDGQAPLELEDLGATPFDQLATREIQAAVQQALRAVPEVFRSAVILRDLEGLSYEEVRSEEHTSELQSLAYLVCRLLLEKKKNKSCNARVRRSTTVTSRRAGPWTRTRVCSPEFLGVRRCPPRRDRSPRAFVRRSKPPAFS